MSSLKEMFLIFFRIGALTLGGGYVMVPIMEDEIVHKRHWIDEKEFIDILAVAQSFPGALAINTSIYVGYKLRKYSGAVVACLGLVLPPLIIISGAAALILRYGQSPLVQTVFMGIRPAVAGLIAAAVFRLQKKLDKNVFNIAMAVAAFIVVAILGVHPIGVILSAGFIGYAVMRWVRGGDK